MRAVCGSPDTLLSTDVEPIVAVTFAVAVKVPLVAVNVYWPGTFGSRIVVFARPLASVVALAGFADPPVVVNATLCPATPAPLASRTSTSNCVGRSWPTSPVCGLPPTVTMVEG
jgi:hypothetical protein